MDRDTMIVEPHGECFIYREHDREWLICHTCNAQWAVHGSDLEPIADGDGYCEEHSCPPDFDEVTGRAL